MSECENTGTVNCACVIHALLFFLISPLLTLSKVLGACPTVSIDKTDGCQVFLSEKSISAEIVSAKSSEMNICIPDGDEFVSQLLYHIL